MQNVDGKMQGVINGTGIETPDFIALIAAFQTKEDFPLLNILWNYSFNPLDIILIEEICRLKGYTLFEIQDTPKEDNVG